jgi:hypothetical protein
MNRVRMVTTSSCYCQVLPSHSGVNSPNAGALITDRRAHGLQCAATRNLACQYESESDSIQCGQNDRARSKQSEDQYARVVAQLFMR